MIRNLLVLGAAIAVAAGGLYATGHWPGAPAAPKAPKAANKEAPPPAITVARVASATFRETVLITGTLVAREEILVTPEIEGFRVVALQAEEGDTVTKGQVLARLVNDTLEAQLAQNTATLARGDANIAQAQSVITQSEAAVVEAKNAFDRAKPLKDQGYLSGSTYDQRESAFRTAEAKLVSARDGLRLAEAEKKQTEATRRELVWKLDKAEVRAPADGLVSRRNARIGGMASAAGDPMFRIIARGEVELEGEVPDNQVAKLTVGKPATVTAAGGAEAKGQVRLISPEVDRTTRLGRVRIYLGVNPDLRIGSFARGHIETATSEGLGVPVAAVMFEPDGPVVQVVKGDRVETRRIKAGLNSGGLVEAREGLAEGELVVAKAGTFVRDGDIIRPVPAAPAKLSEVN